ncbi:MAG: hypothetical protein EA377_05780 [Phycisphaerales bacterium]|nr:MAG: hypothetical protein EA377_05780 [Phycisphaerales bacterium]
MFDERDPEQVCTRFHEAAEVLRANPHRRGSHVLLPGRGRILITGDLHDNPEHFRKIVHAATLDRDSDHHVVLHELIHGEHLVNGMDFSYRMLIKVADLVVKHPAQVHPLLANHELSQMTGKGVSKGAGNSVELFNDALEWTFGDACGEVVEAINAFFHAMPLALRSESGLFCAHSLPNERAMKSFDPDILERELTEEDYHSPVGSAYLMTWGRSYNEAQVNELAQRWGVSLFCLGHQHVETGIDLRLPNVLVLNSDHDRAMVLSLALDDLPEPEEAMMSATPLAAINLPEPNAS